MANILMTYFASKDSFYEALSTKITEMGHNVYILNIFNYVTFNKWGEDYTFKSLETLNSLKVEIEKISIDLVIDFNHAIPPTLTEKLSCPICIWDADNPIHWWNKEYLKKNLDRYVFLGFKSCDKELYEKVLESSIDKYLYLFAGTSVQSEGLDVLRNISFIGSNFYDLNDIVNNTDIIDNAPDRLELFLFLYKEVRKNYFVEKNYLYEESKTTLDKNTFDNYFYYIWWYIYPGFERISFLSVLSDLGLTIYGNCYASLFPFSPDVVACFDKTSVDTIKENQDIYNSSRISINISHPQAKDYFSWRVLDIMASNSCLLTEDKKDFRDLFSPHISEDVMNTIIYKDKYDMRKKAILLLENEELRLRCVKECQECIDKIGRWDGKINSLLKYLNIECLNNNKGISKTLLMQPKSKVVKKHKKRLSPTQRYMKSFFYSLILWLSYTPPFSFSFNEKKRSRFLIKLIKNQTRII